MKILILTLFLIGSFAHAQKMSLEKMQFDLDKVERAIEETKNQMKNMEDTRFLPDLYFVLAEFLVEKSRYQYLIKVEENPDKEGEDLDFTLEKKAKKEAIGVYESFLEKFPAHSDRDRALFFKAHEHRDLGELEDMVKTYAQLTNEHPKSTYWSEAQIALGDYYFEQKKDLELALERYEELIKRPEGPFTPLAYYKGGWIYINKKDFVKAFQYYEKSLKVSQRVDIDSLPEFYKKSDIRENALLAMVWPYSELNKKQMAQLKMRRINPVIYFRNISFSYNAYQKVLGKLGRRMTIKKRYRSASLAYFELLKTSTDLLVRVDAIPRVYASMKNRFKKWPVQNFVEEIARTVVDLKYSTAFSPSEKLTSIKNFEIFARDAATRAQKRVQQTKRKEDYEQVIKNYKFYLWAYPKSKYRYLMRVNLAEAYFNIGAMLKSGMEYEYVALRIGDAKKKKELFDSALQSYSSALKTPDKWDRLEIVQARSGVRGVGSVFLRRYKDDKAIPSILFNIGQTYYDERRFGKAINVFKRFIRKFPNDQRVSEVANQILDAHNQRENYDKMIADGKAIINNGAIKNKVLKDNIRGILKQAQIKKIQKASGEVGSKDYARNLMKFAQKYKGTDIGDQALFEAFITLKSQKDPRAYIPGEQLLGKYGNSKYAKQVVNEMGRMALVTADFRRAAKYFEMFQKKYPGDTESRALLLQAAKLREFMGDYAEAKTNFRGLNDRSAIARMDYLNQNWSKLLQSAKASSPPFSNYWQGVALHRLGKSQAARPFLQKAARDRGGNFETQEMKAHATFLLASKTLDSFKSIRMSPGQEAQAVQKKNQVLQQLTNDFNSVIQSGSGRWTIAAFYGLGQAYKEFGRFIQGAPVPKGLSGAQKSLYKNEIKKQAKNYEANANKFFSDCLQNAEKFEVFTRFVDGCRSKGQEKVDESREIAAVVKARSSEPAAARQVRRRLYDNSRSIPLLIDLAQAYVQARDYAMARAILNRALEIQPDNAEVMAQIGLSLMFMDNFQEAGLWLKKALRSDPRNATALYSVGGLYKTFGFKNKLRSVQSKLNSASRPSVNLHPYSRNL